MFITKTKHKSIIKSILKSEERLVKTINKKDHEIACLKQELEKIQQFDSDELIEHGKCPTKKYFITAAKRLLTEEEFNELKGGKKQKYYNVGKKVRRIV